MTIKYKTADEFPTKCADIASQDQSKGPSFSVWAGQVKEFKAGPDSEWWHDIYTIKSEVDEQDIISLAKKHLGIDIEIESY